MGKKASPKVLKEALSPQPPASIDDDSIQSQRIEWGAKIAAARSAAGLSPEVVAQRMGIDLERYHRIEFGEACIHLAALSVAAFALGIKASELDSRLTIRRRR